VPIKQRKGELLNTEYKCNKKDWRWATISEDDERTELIQSMGSSEGREDESVSTMPVEWRR
jgi:hypothetical protein